MTIRLNEEKCTGRVRPYSGIFVK